MTHNLHDNNDFQRLLLATIEAEDAGVFRRTPMREFCGNEPSDAQRTDVYVGGPRSAKPSYDHGAGRILKLARWALPLAACVGLWMAMGDGAFRGVMVPVPAGKTLNVDAAAALANGSAKCYDLSIFDGCMSGPSGGAVRGECSCVDFDRDGDVDFVDFGYLQRQVSPSRG